MHRLHALQFAPQMSARAARRSAAPAAGAAAAPPAEAGAAPPAVEVAQSRRHEVYRHVGWLNGAFTLTFVLECVWALYVFREGLPLLGAFIVVVGISMQTTKYVAEVTGVAFSRFIHRRGWVAGKSHPLDGPAQVCARVCRARARSLLGCSRFAGAWHVCVRLRAREHVRVCGRGAGSDIE